MMADPLSDDNESTRGVTSQELGDRRTRGLIAEGVHSMIVARVEKFYPAQQRVDVQQMVKDFHRDETGALVVASVPIINSVPVQFLTAGGFTFTVPLIEGETLGSLWFAERSLDRWLTGDGQEVDPQIYSRFNITDAIFMPGVLPFGAPMSVAPPTDHATAGSVTGKRIHFRESVITIGDESGSKALVLDGDSVNAGSLSGTVLVSGSPVAVQFTYTPAGGVPGAPGPTAALTGGKVAASATQAKGH